MTTPAINKDRIKHLQALLERVFDSFFNPQIESDFRWVTWIWIISLIIFGIIFWGKFFNWGSFPYNFHDWAEVNAGRIEFVRNAVRSFQIPFHVVDIRDLNYITDRYMSIPDAILTPQMVLLSFLQLGPFVYVNTVILFLVGTFGLLQFRKKYSFSLVTFTWIFLIFNFNGHITSHFAVGHITWWGYYLLPWFFLLIFDSFDREAKWSWVTAITFIMFLIFLQGSFHFFTWLLFFLGLFGLTSWKRFQLATKTGIAAILLSMVRILPAILLLGKFETVFYGGYHSFIELFNSMILINNPSLSLPSVSGGTTLGWWEYDLFIGLFATLFILYFGVLSWIKDREHFVRFQPLALPAVVLFILSISDIYRYVRMLPIPLLSGERASSRMVIIPFIIVLLIAGFYFQRALISKRLSRVFQLISGFLILVTVFDLWQHLRVWRVTVAASSLPHIAVDLSTKLVGNHPDTPYFLLLTIGAIISLATGTFLIYKTWQERPRTVIEASV